MANTRNVGLKITIDGEKEYKQSIAELNRDNAVLASELKKVQEQYKGNEDSLDALTAKQRIYEEQLATQQRKVEETRTRYEAWQRKLEEVKTAFGATSDEYREAQRHVEDYRIKLNNAETAEIRMQRAVEENTKAIDAQGEEMADSSEKIATLGDQVSGLAEKFGIRIPDSVKSALDNVDGFSTGTVAAMGAAVAGIGAVELAIKGITAGIEAARKLNEITIAQAEKADELLTRSSQTGLGVELLQQLDYAAKFIDFDGLDKSLVKITQSMGEAAKGTEKQTEAFAALGVSIKDDVTGELRNNWDVFEDTIDALGKVENETPRDIIANALFGKSYSELKPLIDAGTDALKKRMEMADVASKEEIEALGRVDDAHQQYESTLERVKQKIAVEFAPTSEAALKNFGDLAERAGNMLVESGIIGKIGNLVEPLGKIAETGLDIASAVLPALVGPLDAAASLFSALADSVQAAWEKQPLFITGWLKRTINGS